MRNKKKGYTLVEILVAIACSSIVLLILVSSLYFLGVTNNKVLLDSSINYNLAVVKDYIIDNELTDETKFAINDSNKNLLYEGKEISHGVEIVSFDIYEKIDSINNVSFIYCLIEYKNSSSSHQIFEFIIK